MPEAADWIVCQLGAREHYVLAEGLHRRGALQALVTDRWVVPGSLEARLPGAGARLAERYNPALADARVVDFTGRSLVREVSARLWGSQGWQRIVADNAWFEERAAAALAQGNLLAGKPVVFAYSYAALGILRAAKAAGCTTVLGQIDPAVTEEQIVAALPGAKGSFQPTPPAYWPRWREECALADHIVVNSQWSRDGLVQAGIDPAKLAVVPLAYSPPPVPPRAPRPTAFSDDRPLHVLFLGSQIARKGIAEVLDAARLLAARPVKFHLVGPGGAVPADLPRVIDHGPVSRHGVHDHFARADLFVLPTHSDGFALTQLEAQAHGLPVIASRRCGDVVTDEENGLLLPEVTGAALAAAIDRYVDDPALLAAHGDKAPASLARFAPDRIIDQLQALVA